jgi:DNA polymerase IV
MIFHIDMDAFYASVEILDNPEFKGKPVIVGGLSGRGVVAAASYEARKYGVHSAMPMFQALKKCPDARVVPPRKTRYKQVSENVMEILKVFPLWWSRFQLMRPIWMPGVVQDCSVRLKPWPGK